ncbi:MAG: hypothetical protein K2M20_00820 [Lachnospiraceae bacterium]|nr:hypothetical protein [Lachnospiraceae bacterium]MDE6603625.1 hypothetical protein [Lachnospiraceae bacterium]MDE7358239.1 hypothetical protein [Lachnospiraceae bacterium]
MGENLAEKELPEVQKAADGEKGNGNSNNRKNRDTRVGLTLRILVSVYVLYLAYGLIQGFGDTTGNDRIFIAAAIVVFVAAGGAILILSAKKLIKKEYVDADGQTEDDEEQ